MRLVIKNTSEEEKKKLEKLKRRTAKQERSELSDPPVLECVRKIANSAVAGSY
jgi:hypothetical protein